MCIFCDIIMFNNLHIMLLYFRDNMTTEHSSLENQEVDQTSPVSSLDTGTMTESAGNGKLNYTSDVLISVTI